MLTDHPLPLSLDREARALLLLSRLQPTTGILEDAGKIMSDSRRPLDWERLVSLSVINELAGLLYKNLRNSGSLPPDAQDRLRKAYLFTVAKNSISAGETLKIIGLLNDRKVEAVPLKGALASDIIFGDPGLYPAADIDLLVRPADLHTARDILMEEGYRYDEGREKDMLSSHYHLVFCDDRQTVEVHWNLVKRYFQIPPEFWWEGVYREGYGGGKITLLSPEKYLMYAVFRLLSHDFHPLKFLVFTAELINKYGPRMNWSDLIFWSKKYRMSRLIFFTMRLTSELLGARVPEEVAGREVAAYGRIKNEVFRGLFGEMKRPFSRRIVFLFLLDSPLSALKGFLGRLFPGRGELRLRYGLTEGSGKVYLYYLLNIILLPRMILRRKA